MKEKRRLLFYIEHTSTGPFPYTFDAINTSCSIQKTLDYVLNEYSLKYDNVSKNPDDYTSYDWELKELNSKMLVGEIPEPGIVIVVRSDEFAIGYALLVQSCFKSSKDPVLQDLLNSFLNTPKGQEK